MENEIRDIFFAKNKSIVPITIIIRGRKTRKNASRFHEPIEDRNKTPIKQLNCGNKIQQHC